MTPVIDILIFLEESSVIKQIYFTEHFQNDGVQERILRWKGYSPAQVPGSRWDMEKKTLAWNGLHFRFERLELDDGSSCLLLVRENLREKLMEAALNQFRESVELYDARAVLLFANHACKRMMDIPENQDIEGQTLLELFDASAEYSTNLTALRTRTPVRDRFDSYKSTTGKDLETLNYAYPVVEDKRLLGCISFEWDVSMTQKKEQELAHIQQLLNRRLTSASKPSQTIHYTLDSLIGSSPRLREAVELAARMAPKDSSVLIHGETGTGKELFAQGIHAASTRSSRKFIAVNCAAFPETLIEGMLFGTVKGAFTGSVDRAGLIETANHGTLFLDEINSMSLPMQAKLLRVLQERTLQRVGSTTDIPIDVRLLASTNEDPFSLIENGTMRKDLFYRIASVIVEIPPLRERAGDLEELTWYYIRKNSAEQAIKHIEPAFWKRLRQHDWPGNVRELFHILNYALNVAEDGVLRESDLPAYFPGRSQAKPEAAPLYAEETLDFQSGLNSLVQQYERHVLMEAYAQCGENATRTAELLKISRQSFQYYAKKYKLNQ